MPAGRAARAAAPLAFAAAMALAPAVRAQTGGVVRRSPAESARLAMDPAITTGTLPNGLRYYIRPNAVPAKRAELRLVVDAGSALEDDDQRGLAHFVEHMAFNGTTHFAKLDIVRYLESLGMQFGADLNARTTFDETTYFFTVPTDAPGAVRTGIRILADWAHGITFDSAAVEAERGIILGEWRSRTDAGGLRSRLTERYMDELLRGSRYERRLPIGLPTVVQSAPVAELRRFYHDWYTPDRMAVIVVGDVDAGAVEALIRRELGAIPAAHGGRERPSLAVPLAAEPVFAVVADSQSRDGSATVAYRLPERSPGTAASFRAALVERLIAYVLSERLGDLDRGSIRMEEPARGFRSYTLRATARDGDARRALAKVLGVVQQAVEHGITADELERVRAYMLREYENNYARRDALSSHVRAEGLTRSFLTGASVPGLGALLELARASFTGASAITRAEVNAMMRDILGRDPSLVLVAVPPAPLASRAAPITARSLARLADSVVKAPTPTHAAELASAPLLAELPRPGSVDSVHALAGVGGEEWVLSNGARVIVKRTDFDPNQLLVKAVAPGGTSLAADSDYVEAALATQLLAVGGLGRFPLSTLRKRLRSGASSVELTPFISELSQGITASTSPRDAPTLFEMLYLAFTAPRLDSAAVERWRTRTSRQLATGQADVSRQIRTIMMRHHPRSGAITPAMVDSLDPARALAFYRARFADAGNFTFYIVGSFEPDSLKRLVERYIAALPAAGTHESWRDTGVRPVGGPGTIDAAVSPYARTTMRLVITGPMRYDAAENMVFNALGVIARRRLLDRLRTELHATYGVQLSTSAAKWPWSHYELEVGFDAAPGAADSLATAAIAVLDTLRANGPTRQEVTEARALEERRIQSGQRENGYWLDMLSHAGWNGWDYVSSITNPEPLIDALTPERLENAARHYLDTAHILRIAIRPR